MCVASETICQTFFLSPSDVDVAEWDKVQSNDYSAHSDDFSKGVYNDLAKGTKPGCYGVGDDGFNVCLSMGEC